MGTMYCNAWKRKTGKNNDEAKRLKTMKNAKAMRD